MQVKALRQALKDVPSALDKNERFRRISALVGGGHNKKDCYDKYKELKAEAKTKQTTLRTASGMSIGSTGCRENINIPSSAGSGRLSRRGSTFSSWSSNSADTFGQHPQHKLQSRRSTASSTLSSVPSEPPEEINGCGSTDRGIGSNPKHDGLEGMDAAGKGVCDSKSCAMSNSAGGVTISRRGGGGHDTAREAVNNEEELIEVEEVDVEDFCLDDELVEAGPSFAAATAPVEARGSSVGAYSTGRNSKISPASARGGDTGGGANQLMGRATVTEVEASGVRELMFGDPSRSFNDAWREQGFYFCGVDGLRYGLVQAEGGPCGILAAVQAFLLQVQYLLVCVYQVVNKHPMEVQGN